MSVDGPRTSEFTFQSTVHSMHVLNSLNEQRQKDILCDVTVELESRCFRAHGAVLACCSDYFYTRLINHTGSNQVITLPNEITIEGFVPLLQFAYTAILHFTKENILEIHRCAELLGFHNLDKACFDFLVPKLSVCSQTAQKAKETSEKATEGTSSDEKLLAVNDDCSSTSEPYTTRAKTAVLPESGEEMLQIIPSAETHPEQCSSVSSKDMPFSLPSVPGHSASEHGPAELCLQDCGPQLIPSSVATGEVCPFLSMPCESENEKENAFPAGCEGDILEMGEAFQNALAIAGPVKPLTSEHITKSPFGQAVDDLETSADRCELCPLGSTDTSVLDSVASVGNTDDIDAESPEVFESTEQILSDPGFSGGFTERSMVEREVAEHLAKGFWPDMQCSLVESVASTEQAATVNGSDFHWMRHLDLGAAPDDCPFLKDLSSREDQSVVESLAKESYPESALQSDENSTCGAETECLDEDITCGVNLPYPVEQISSMSRRAFLQLLKQPQLTPDQLEFVQDIRRRSKNRVAAQRSRKKKLDCIDKLEGDIKKLKIQRDKLLQEQKQLMQSMEDTQQSLFGLYDSGSMKVSLSQEQLQVISRYLSPDWPISVLLTPTSPHSLPDLEQAPQQPQSKCPAEDKADNNNSNNNNTCM